MIDVCLILEGTYPFVAGGVSTWIHQLITHMPDCRFSIINISPYRKSRREYKYPVPNNVIDIQDVFLHDYSLTGPISHRPVRFQKLNQLKKSHQELLKNEYSSFESILGLLRSKDPLTIRDLFDTKEGWTILKDLYNQTAKDISFVDFFWTWRSVYLPLYNVLTTALPKARLYHTISTGYAGLIATIAKIDQNKKMLLTEHGIYTHERLLEISQANWIQSFQQSRIRIERDLPFFKKFWLGLFQTMGRLTYHYADEILTLYEGNQAKQIREGASPNKISIIPNGIEITPDQKKYFRAPNLKNPSIGFVGRVVPIKDVKTFLQACHTVLRQIPGAKFFIIGPTDEEPEYALECQQMVSQLKMDNAVRFTGKVNVKEYYQLMDLVVLTSLSEAQPYVIIEANAMGLPVVATDVGACREMVEGRLREDRELGLSGKITRVADPEGTAKAILDILGSQDKWESMSKAGVERTARYYDQDDLLSQYLNLYEKNIR